MLKNIASALLCLLALSACSEGPKAPAEQVSFGQTLSQLRSAHDKAKDQNNDLRITEVEERARRFFKSPPRIEGWVGTVDGVSTFAGAQWATVKEGGVLYQLKPLNESVAARMRRYSKGDWVQFSGDVRFETNITIGQAIRSPELVVFVFEVDPYVPTGN